MAERLPRPDRVEGRALSPRAFRTFGIEAVVLGPATTQEGLVRREGVAVWRRMAEHAPVFDRLAATAAVDPDGLLPVRVVVAATPARDRAMRVPAIGERATRVQAAAEPPPSAGWLLLGLFLSVYGSAVNLGSNSQLAGVGMILASLAALVAARPR